MKRIWVLLLFLLSIAPPSNSLKIRTQHFGDVDIWRSSMEWPGLVNGAVYMDISGWDKPSLQKDLDSAFVRVKYDTTLRHEVLARAIILGVKDCAAADSNCVKEAVGRFITQGVGGIEPSGTWQWGGPLVINTEDTARCEMLGRLRGRRWTEFVTYDSTNVFESTEKVNHSIEDLIRRYRRERVDRMEEMFRK